MAVSWRTRRQLRYYIVFGVLGILLLGVLGNIFLTEHPTCSDGRRNGTELGIDCGGSCSLVCKNTASSPRILWARAFQTDPSVYAAAAYVENPNLGAGARAVRYSFQLFDDKNILIAERDGVTDLPPATLIPIVELNINTGARVVTRTLFSFADTPTWNTVSGPKPELRLTAQELLADGSRLSATINNNSLEDAKRVTVAAVLFDAGGVARGASKTTLTVARKASQQVVFTWPSGVPNIVRAEVTIVPSF